MTTAWKSEPIWTGQTVAVMACGPSLTSALAESLREHRTIVVNDACKVAPWADMLVALDAGRYWTQEMREFAGLRLTGIEDDGLDAHYIGHRFERVTLAPGHQVEIRNSGLAAIRIAGEMGAARILLAGFDPEQPGHFYDDQVDTGEYVGLAAGLRQITAELAARGVTVERVAPKPAPKAKKTA
ncbi:MAG TPA: hypothetical protein VGD76_04655 [Ramlibacter sp.]